MKPCMHSKFLPPKLSGQLFCIILFPVALLSTIFLVYLIMQAMKFLYSQGFPKCVLGHVQTGNIFVVNDVCQLGGYENTLLGYKTRLFRLCKDDLQHFDIILFGTYLILSVLSS